MMRTTTLLAFGIAIGCGGAGAGTDVVGAPHPATSAPAAPPPVPAQIARLAGVEGNLVCATTSGTDAWAIGVWATTQTFRRLGVGGGALEPMPGFPNDGAVAAGSWIAACPYASPDGSLVAYGVLEGERAVVHVRGADGANDRALGPGWPIGWSTGGADVVALDASMSAPTTRVFALPAAGGAARPIWEVAPGRMLAFEGSVSPDGTTAAVVSAPVGRPGSGDVFVVPTAGGEARPLTSDGLENADPTFTPDGRGVVLASRRSGDVDLWVVPTSGGEGTLVAAGPGIESAPAVSRDGRGLLFGWRDPAPSVVTVRSPANGAPRTLAGTADDATDVRLSPDGATVAFARGLGTETNLYVQSLAGAEAHAIATLPGADHSPAFSPDNRSVAYVSTREGPGDIYLLALAGGGARRLTEGSGVVGRLVFSPDGQKLAYSRLKDGVIVLTVLPLGGGAPVDLGDHVTSYAFDPDGRTILATVDAGERAEVRRIKVDGSGSPETLRWSFPWTRFLSVSGPRGRTKALLFEDTDRRRLIRVDVARGTREVLSELPPNLDLMRFSLDASADGATLVTTESLLTTELRSVTNAAEVLRSRLP
jgi:TolB protein